jgi:hypothetical protein
MAKTLAQLMAQDMGLIQGAPEQIHETVTHTPTDPAGVESELVGVFSFSSGMGDRMDAMRKDYPDGEGLLTEATLTLLDPSDVTFAVGDKIERWNGEVYSVAAPPAPQHGLLVLLLNRYEHRRKSRRGYQIQR